MDAKEYISERITEFEKKLAHIAKCKELEINKLWIERSTELLLLLDKEEVLFSFCLTEFRIIQQYI